MLVRRERIWGLVAVIAALHLVVLSVTLGPRCIAYIVAAYLTAVVVWGGVSMSTGKRRLAAVVGLVVTVVIQQVALNVWKAELVGCWWPLVQFYALQLLIGLGVQCVIRRALRSGASDEQHITGKERKPAA